MKIGDFSVSTLDFPDAPALVIFTGGCPFKCPYCHNPELVDGGRDIPIKDVHKKILEVQDFIDAIVISGGEPLVQIDEVEDILKFAKSLKLKTKLDTNGYYPKRVEKIIDLLDYVALDIKTTFENYEKVFGFDGERVKRSMEIIAASKTFLECRTTYVPGILKPDDILEIAAEIKCNLYVIQQFRNRYVLDPRLRDVNPPSPSSLRDLASKAKGFGIKVKIRTQEFGEEDI